MPESAHVLALAYQGRLAEARGRGECSAVGPSSARAFGERDLATDESLGFVSAVALHLRSMGFTELQSGNPAVAVDHFLRALSIASQEVGIGEPAILRLHPDAIVALVALGRIEEAARLTHQLDASTQVNHLPWSTTMAGRCHGLLSAATGHLPAALDVLQQALVDHELLPMPFEEARTRLLFGSVLRRSGHRSDARRELEAANAVFVRLGTPIQSDQAHAELASVGGRRSHEGELTAVEARIAALVAAGHTNGEVAGTLFLSVRTVEGHLGRIYRKRPAFAHRAGPSVAGMTGPGV